MALLRNPSFEVRGLLTNVPREFTMFWNTVLHRPTVRMLALATMATALVGVGAAAASASSPSAPPAPGTPSSAEVKATKPLVANPDAAVRTNGTVYLPSVGGVYTTVIAMWVPAGDWVVQAKATAVNFGAPGDLIRCSVFNNGQTVGVGSTTYVGGGVWASGLANTGVLHTGTPVTLLLRCSHDANGSTAYTEDSALLATRYNAIDG